VFVEILLVYSSIIADSTKVFFLCDVIISSVLVSGSRFGRNLPGLFELTFRDEMAVQVLLM